MHGITQNQKVVITFHPFISQSTPVSISSISPKSSLELDTEHGNMTDEIITHITHIFKQILMAPNQHNINKNEDPIDPPQQYL